MTPTRVAPSSSLGYTCYAGGGRLCGEWADVGVAGAGNGRDPGVFSHRGPAALAAADFLLPGLDGVVFVAWGSNDGVVYVGYYIVREEEEAGGGGVDGSQRVGLRTVLALPLRGSAGIPASHVRRVVYGGGPKALLMAASDTVVAVFSLESFVYEMVDHLESAVGFLGNGLERHGRYRVCEREVVFGAESVVAVGWTGRWDGVLVSTVCDGAEQPVGSKGVAHLRMWAVGESGMEIIWSTETAGIQRIVQGGVSAFSPCVTASGGEVFASVWWYDSGDGRDVQNGDGDHGGGRVRREELKHPTVVMNVEWSAGVLRKEDAAAGQLQDGSRPLEDHPAIMTVDAEGCVRIWVEMMVMMSIGSCDCYFAMNLVIPPGNGAGDQVETKAMWVKPVDHAFQRHSHHVNTQQRILWLIVSRGRMLSLYALRGLAPVVVSSALTSPGGGAHPDTPNGDASTRSSHQQAHPGSRPTSAQPKKPQLLLWGQYAWEGLVGGVNTRLSARMLHGDDFPIVDCIETGMDDGGNFLLSSGVSLVTMLPEDVCSSLQPAIGAQQGIHLKRAWSGFGRLRGYDIVCTLVMRRFVAMLDASGCLDVWRLSGIGAPMAARDAPKQGRDLMAYYGSLPIGEWLEERSDLSDVSMMEVTSTPAGYDSIVLVLGCRRVMQIAVATNPERMDIGIVGDWRLRNAGMVQVMKDHKGGMSFSVTCVRADEGRILCESYDNFAKLGRDLDGYHEQTQGRSQDLVPSLSAVLPVTLENAETILHLRNAEQRRAIMIGTSAGRVFLFHMGQIRAFCSKNALGDGREAASLPNAPSADASEAPLLPTRVPTDDVETFSVENFHGLEYDPVHELLAVVHASDDRILTVYRLVAGERWCAVACGEIRCQSSVATAKWMIDEVLPCIAIADKAGRVAMFALDNTRIDSWAAIASFQGGRGGAATLLSYANSCLVCTSGRSAGIVGMNVQEPNGRVQKLGKVLLSASGPLPLYHPNVLRALVLSGHLDAFFDVLTELKTWLEEIDCDDVDSLECCSRESSDLPSPSGEQARAMPHMFPGVSMDRFITNSSADISKTLSKIEAVLCDQGSREDQGADGKGHGDGRPQGSVSSDAPHHVEASDAGSDNKPPIETGMLDMSAFGMGMISSGMARPNPVAPAAPVQSLETGMLDMSAFGMGVTSSGMITPGPVAPSVSAQSVDTGMLDMSAFGMGMPQTGMPAPGSGYGEPQSPTTKHKPCITLGPSKTFSLQQCQKYRSILDELINRMKSTRPDSGVSDPLPSNTRYVPGLGEEEAARLDASIRTTRDVLTELQQDIGISTAVFLLSLAWCAENNTTDVAGGAKQDAEDVDAVTRKPSFVNAAGVPMDYGRLDEDTSMQSRTSTGLSGVLGLGPLVSAEALLWMCLSPQDGSQAMHVVKKIQGEVLGSRQTSWKQPNARNSSHAFLAVPQSKSDAANTWESLRSTGVAFWQQDKTVLMSLLEDCAKAKFRQTRDPDTVALLYAAIGKTSVLRGLYKTCNRTKEAEFFSRDFSQDNNKVAANKNAFVLLGQHRYAMAATFFVLGGKLHDAVEVCLHQMADLQLAIVLHRALAEEDLNVGDMLRETLQAYEHLSVASFLRHWVSGNLPGAIESLLTIRHPSEGIWLVQALLQVASASSGGAAVAGGGLDADPTSMLHLAAVLSADVLNRCGMSVLAIESELVAAMASKQLANSTLEQASLSSISEGGAERKSGRSKREASNACALTLVEAPVSLIPDLFAEEDFNQRIGELMARIEDIQKHGMEVSTNVVLQRVERIYKSLSYSETTASPATPKCETPGSLAGAFGGLGLCRPGSMDAQSRTSNQTSGFSSLKRTSLDDAHESQQLAKMISRSKLADSADESAPQIVYPRAVEIFRVDADNIQCVCSCPLLAPDVCGRLVAISTVKNGVLEFATHPDVAVGGHGPAADLTVPGPFQKTPRHDSPKHQSGMFSKFVSQIFDQTSWMTDPLENQSVMIDGDVGLAAGVHGENSTTPRSPDAARLADAKMTQTKILVAHPHRQLFLSGCRDTARIKLWQYDGPRPVRLFTPVPRDDLQRLASMNHDIFSMSSNFSQSQSLTSKMSHWGKAVDMCFSENGERFASIGEGGVVAVWSLDSSFTKDAGTDIDGASCSEWWHTCLKNQGRSVAFVGGRSAVVAAAGQCDAGNITLWNTSLPDRESCIGRLRHHKAPVNKVKTLPGGWLLASADDAGILSLSDVRMLGSSDRDAVLWSTKACKGVVRAIDTITYESIPAARQHSFKRHHFIPGNDAAIVTGGDDGLVRLWDVNSGRLLQQSEPVYPAKPNTSSRLRSLTSGGGDAKYTVTGLDVCEEGVLSSGSDGVVRLYVRS